MAEGWPKKRRLLGTKVQRLDGPEKATGKAKYSYDINRPGMLHAVMLRCPHAHARVKSIDTAAAEKMPGVKAVHLVVKAGAELYYAGDEVLAIAADTEERALDAVRAVKVEYDKLPFLVKEEDALRGDKNTAPPFGPKRERRNLRPPQTGTTGGFAAGMAAADAVIIEGTYGSPVICHHCLEPHGLVAEWG